MNVSTKELSEELVQREGVSVLNVDSHEECVITTGTQQKKIIGPAVIIINQD
ncbi:MULTISPECIES: BC1881 family protein [Bacillus cereus group]|uniref:BC1881 family protein n=1 Tax=Bacillus proteolyticus TaxID=2026192 RepID=A0ABV3II57_9BACI|nr:BC1881 family protein [Bacillus cereus group sp. N8]MBJ8107419.1 BC1881 family protein [Bacillus cereus group sp. N8]